MVLAVVIRVVLLYEALAFAGWEEQIIRLIAHALLGLQLILLQGYVWALLLLPPKALVRVYLTSGRRSLPEPSCGAEVTLACEFLEVFAELVELDVVLLALVIVLLARVVGVVGLLGAGLVEIDGGLLAHGLEGLLHALDAAVLLLQSILLRCVLPALQDGRVVVLGVALVCYEGILVLVYLYPPLVLFLNVLHY